MPSRSPCNNPPTDAAMLAAWQQLRGPDWPSLGEITRSAALYQLVRGAALRKAQGQPIQATTSIAPSAAPTPGPARSAKTPRLLPVFDHKRAAAGEREGD